jgi:hypothetical protein
MENIPEEDNYNLSFSHYIVKGANGKSYRCVAYVQCTMQTRNAYRCVSEGNLCGENYLGEPGLDERIILWRVDPFLSSDGETNKTRAIAMQHILNKQQLKYHSEGTVGSGVFCGSRRDRS